MTLKTFLISAALTFLPGLAMASCGGHEKQVMSCAQGTSWDHATQTCTPLVSG